MSEITFHGDRLREAREARGFTLQQIADHLSLSKSVVGLYEKARCKPSFGVLQKLVELLRVEPHYFTRVALPPHSGPTFYRSMASATIASRNVAEQKIKWVREICEYLSSRVEFPAVSLPECHYPSDPLKIRDADVESAAVALRRYWGLGDGVISNVVALLENKGIIVSRFSLETDKIDAFSIVDDSNNRPLIVLAADKANLFRSRMDAAHELGHLILHRNVPKQVLSNTVAFKAMEEQAFQFGGAFLMPAKTFGLEYFSSSLESFKAVKLKWKAAIAAMIMRAGQLGMISETQLKSLWINRSRMQWVKVEPYDNEFQAESPLLLSRAFEMIAPDSAARSQVLLDLALDKSDIESLAGAEGFFTSVNHEESIQPPILKFPKR